MPAKINRPTARETGETSSYGRKLCIKLCSPYRVQMWEKGRRAKYEITFGQIWSAVIRLRLDAERKRIALERKEKRKARPTR